MKNCRKRIRLCIAAMERAERSTYVSSQFSSVLFILKDSKVIPNANGRSGLDI